MDYQAFRGIHKGAVLLVGNGENLHLTPPEWFDLPSFGMNTIYRYEGWKPTYYTAVDNRVMREFGKEISEKYSDISKFIPTGLKDWQGENFIVFNHLADDLKRGWKPNTLQDGITYHSSMHVAMQLAFWMGFETLLMVGIHHKPGEARNHFWGSDMGMPVEVPVDDWMTGYSVLTEGMRQRGIKVLNISEDTYVPESILPRGRWKDWSNDEKSKNVDGLSGF